MINEKKTNLLPCPFCGGKPKEHLTISQWIAAEIECESCRIKMSICVRREENTQITFIDALKPEDKCKEMVEAIIEKWNARA